MTGKLTRSAREVIVDAMGRAHSDAAGEVREEHLLAAVITDPDMRPLLTKVGGLSDAAALLAEVKQSRRRAGVSPVETDALAQFGVESTCSSLERRRSWARARWMTPAAVVGAVGALRRSRLRSGGRCRARSGRHRPAAIATWARSICCWDFSPSRVWWPTSSAAEG